MAIEKIGLYSRNRGVYKAPLLTHYGSVMQLTAAGSGTLTENGGPGNCSQTASRRPC